MKPKGCTCWCGRRSGFKRSDHACTCCDWKQCEVHYPRTTSDGTVYGEAGAEIRAGEGVQMLEGKLYPVRKDG